jgi:hypothetical protein
VQKYCFSFIYANFTVKFVQKSAFFNENGQKRGEGVRGLEDERVRGLVD